MSKFTTPFCTKRCDPLSPHLLIWAMKLSCSVGETNIKSIWRRDRCTNDQYANTRDDQYAGDELCR